MVTKVVLKGVSYLKRPCEKRKHQGETEGREYRREVQEDFVGRKTLEMVPSGRRKRGRPKQRWMDCVNRYMRAIGTTKDEVHDRTGWMGIVLAAATPQPSESG